MTQPIKYNTKTVNTYDLEDVMQYIIDAEFDDFHENPSENHVYFKAVSLIEGRETALSELDDALATLETNLIEKGLL